MAAAAGQRPMNEPAPRALMPPYLVLNDFLPEETAAGLLDFALAHETAFEPTKTGHRAGGGVDPEMRVSVGTRDLGPFKPVLKSAVLGLLPDLIARLGATPVGSARVELQLVAHNDGAFYKRHTDTQTAPDRRSIRVLSGVYYFHARPKAFTGGALRLYAIGDPDKKTFVDVEPTHNSLLVFPSWAPHEVTPIRCPSARFADSRFAVNCWVYRKAEQAI
ncbi:MAG TPA: 2OG-Fe(II) oxygenase [Pseudolabrys sp.]|nr:2OG-Fe(II) oxygenase [Pseudolabrys sp.]